MKLRNVVNLRRTRHKVRGSAEEVSDTDRSALTEARSAHARARSLKACGKVYPIIRIDGACARWLADGLFFNLTLAKLQISGDSQLFKS